MTPEVYRPAFGEPGAIGCCSSELPLGRTTGRGKNAPSKRRTRSIKDVLGYPLRKRFRELLAAGR